VTLKNDSPFNMKDIVIKGQLTLPPKGQLTEYVYGDLTNFGIKVDTRTLRVAWVQFALAKAASQVVTFPVCVRKRDFVVDVELQLQLEDYSVDAAPEPINLQTTTNHSSVSITAFP
jgi:hypothetical protein